MQELPKKKLKGKYNVKSMLGKGAQGIVYLGYDVKDNKPVAIKELNINTEKAMKTLMMEIENLKILSYMPCYKNISCYKDSFIDPTNGKIYLILDYYEGKTLDNAMIDIKNFYGDKIYYDVLLDVLIKLLITLDYVHDKDVIHGDIKLHNIILDINNIEHTDNIELTIKTDFNPILLDFGLSCTLKDSSCLKFSGTPNYMAPEVLKDYKKSQKLKNFYPTLSFKSDIWALGITFYAILNDGKIWPKNLGISQIFDYIISGKQKFTFDTPNKHLNKILESMLKYDPSERLDAKELLNIIYT